MATGVNFLQRDFEDSSNSKNVGSYKPGNTDVIRTMLREQQKECQVLHANALFREFRGDGQKQRKFGKGYVVQGDNNAPMFDDFQAEGQSRMFELIKGTALKEQKQEKGVWASFGKPYVCLGDLDDSELQLPELWRDKLNGENKQNNSWGRTRRSKAPSSGQAASAQALTKQASMSRARTAESRCSTAGKIPPELMESVLTKSKSVLKFTNNDLAETKFPDGPLKMASHRLMKSKAAPGSFMDQHDASNEYEDPALAYGAPKVLARRALAPMKLTKGAPREEEGGHGPGFFVTQGGGTDEGGLDPAPSFRQGGSEAASVRNAARSSVGGHRKSISGESQHTEAVPETSVHPGPPEYKPVSEMAVPAKGDEDNPVYKWHNDFVQVRQRGREGLQQALWERADGRIKARSVGPLAAHLSTAIMADLDLTQGKKKGYATLGLQPISPYNKMEASYNAQQEGKRSRARQAGLLDPNELRVLQRFYDQLCALVEQQRMSDPLSLMVVHKVKALLEAGVFLNRTMLTAVVDHVAKFAKGAGLQRYNKYMLSVFTFVAKCVGVSDADLEDLLVECDVCMVVYGTPLPPSRMRDLAGGSAGPAPGSAGLDAPGGRGKPGKSPIGSRLKLPGGPQGSPAAGDAHKKEGSSVAGGSHGTAHHASERASSPTPSNDGPGSSETAPAGDVVERNERAPTPEEEREARQSALVKAVVAAEITPGEKLGTVASAMLSTVGLF